MSRTPKSSITSEKRLRTILAETEAELDTLQPRIDRLEKQLQTLQALRMTKQKLITLRMSLKTMLDNYTADSEPLEALISGTAMPIAPRPMRPSAMATGTGTGMHAPMTFAEDGSQVFMADRAMDAVTSVLKKRGTLNLDIFRAIVNHGGRATTEQIKSFLVEHGIKQPTTGEGFEQAGLSVISSRVNYLVRRGVVQPNGHGLFSSRLGWVDAEAPEPAEEEPSQASDDTSVPVVEPSV